MDRPTSRSELMSTILIAHAVGLFAAGVAGTIGTTSGLSFSGGGLGLLVGGMLSIPWLVVIGVFVWFQGGLIERNTIGFAVLGPILVCGTYAYFMEVFWQATAISSVVSSAVYLPLALWQKRRRTALD